VEPIEKIYLLWVFMWLSQFLGPSLCNLFLPMSIPLFWQASEPKAHLQQCFMCSASGPAVSADLSVHPAHCCLCCTLVKLYMANQMISWHVVFCQLCSCSCSWVSCTIAQCQGSHVYHCTLIGCSPCISSPCAAHLMYHTCKLVHSGCWIKHSVPVVRFSHSTKMFLSSISCFVCLYAFNFNLLWDILVIRCAGF
jgi:hypothetical protein